MKKIILRKWKLIFSCIVSGLILLLVLLFLNLSLITDKKPLIEKTNYLLSQAKIHFNQKEFELSLKNYVKVLDLDPFNEEAYNGVTNVSKNYGLLLFEQGKNLDETNKKYEELGITPVLLANLKKNLDKDYDNSQYNSKEAFFLLQSLKYCSKKEPEKAINLLKKVKGSEYFNEESERILFRAYINLALSLRYFKNKN
ncbi:MAG: hypothetical protein AABZ74_08375 [Cyanobacteriota bacterium]